MRTSRALHLLLAVAVALVALAVAPPASQAAAFVRLGGDGSSFAAPAIDQWSTDVANRGIIVQYTADGSAAGRQNYIQDQTDFAGTDIQFLTTADPFGGGTEHSQLAYSYIPVVAGGTAFLYHLKVGNRAITDLRLSGSTLALIFTGVIKNWSDKRITKDYGAQLASEPITVVTRSDGSGASYQFTRFLSHQYPAVWDAFCKAHDGPSSHCGPTEFYPSFAGSQQRNGSDQVANYVSASYAEGSIGYDEFSYAKSRGVPVVKVLNAAGYFTQPFDKNVAIALQAAVINEDPSSPDFLIQNLDSVYGMTDPRAYPVSSYSYLVVPRDSLPGTDGPPTRFTADKGKTLSTWLNYVLCGAQQSAGNLGYSALPKNLVVGGFRQVLHIPGNLGVPDLNKLDGCNNPTYSNGVNLLIKTAVFPTACDKYGSPLNCVITNGQAKSGGSQAAGTGNRRSGSNTTGNGGSATGGGTTTGSGTTGSGTTSGSGPGGSRTRPATSGTGGSAPSSTTVDPITGEANNANDVTAGGAGQQQVYAVPVSTTDRAGGRTLFSVLTAAELLGAVLAPGLIGIWLQRRRRTGV